jgi:MbtH protein
MSNPFEDPDAQYLVLVNDEGQYSLWPESMSTPPGWSLSYGSANRQECLDYIERTWTDMRPLSLVRHMDGA